MAYWWLVNFAMHPEGRAPSAAAQFLAGYRMRYGTLRAAYTMVEKLRNDERNLSFRRWTDRLLEFQRRPQTESSKRRVAEIMARNLRKK